MAGSRKNFFYTDDTGQAYAISLDESNTEAINGAVGDIPDTSTANVALPRNIKPRELFYVSGDNARTIRCVALTPAIYSAAINGGASTIPDPLATGNQVLQLARVRGERRTVYRGVDTGINDGDDT